MNCYLNKKSEQMKKHLDKASQGLFGLKPEKTRLIIAEPIYWDGLSNLLGFDFGVVGVYFPHNYLAIVQQSENTDELTRRCVHEYLGHGLFYEHESIGEIVNSFNVSISELETELFGRKIGKNDKFKVLLGDNKQLIEVEDANYTYAAIITDRENYQNYCFTNEKLKEINNFITLLSEKYAERITIFVITK